MSNYENAPATKMLATNCVCCGRPLVDATSVQLGIGPECRKEWDGGIPNEVREQANKIVRDAACAAGIGRIAEVLEAADKVEALGLAVLAGKMRRRFRSASNQADIIIEAADGGFKVVTPYRRKDSKAFIEAWRHVPGRRWVAGANIVPVESKAALWRLLCDFFPGRYGKGPKGVFRVPEAAPSASQTEMKLA